MKLEGRVALVTGAGNGMGRATVKMMLAEGASVVGMDIFEDDLQSLQEEVKELPGKLEIYAGDLRNSEAIKGMVAFTVDKFKKIDILACIAGVVDDMAPIEYASDEVWEDTININVTSVFKTIREAIPHMKDHEQTANIVTVSSVGGLCGTSSGVSYIASKHAVQGMMKNVAFAYMANNIRCNNVAPGAMATNIMASAERLFPERDVVSEECGVYYQRGLLTQLLELGTSEDIANAIMFLVSDEAKYINGTTLVVDNGWSCM